MDSYIYNTLMCKYIRMLEDKQLIMNSLYDLSCDVHFWANVYNENSKLTYYRADRLNDERNELIRCIKSYHEEDGKLKDINESLFSISKTIHKFNKGPRKVKFLIPGTTEFERMKEELIPDDNILII